VNLGWLSLGALFTVIVVSCVSTVNVGLLAVTLAWIVGTLIGGMKIDTVISGFPAPLFLTLAGVMLLFSQAQVNGTLDRVARIAVSLCRGNAGLIPILFFVMGLGLSTMGPGNIATAALLAPPAMGVAARAGIPAFLMAIMVGNGVNAGSLSPLAPTGIIMTGLMQKVAAPDHEWRIYFDNAAAHAGIAFAAYFLFGGGRLLARRAETLEHKPQPLERNHWITLAVIGALLGCVILFKANAGMAALAGAVLLTVLRAADEEQAIKRMPWNVIVMVTGMTVLIVLLEKTSGIAIFSDLLARVATRESVTAVIAFITALISVYSSTSGVVIPAFVPAVPGLLERLGGGDIVAVASSIAVGSHLVDLSPLSTIGALCIAATSESESRSVFRKLLAWGLAMTVVGAAICYLMFGLP